MERETERETERVNGERERQTERVNGERVNGFAETYCINDLNVAKEQIT